jgi:hypothetical protein
MSIKECQQKCADVRTVNVGIGSDNNFVIAKFGKVKGVANSRAKSHNKMRALLLKQAFYRDELARHSKFFLEAVRRLSLSITALLGCTTGRISFDNK